MSHLLKKSLMENFILLAVINGKYSGIILETRDLEKKKVFISNL